MFPLFAVVNPVFLLGWVPGLLAAYALCVVAVLLQRQRLKVDPFALLIAVLAVAYVVLNALASPFSMATQAIYQATILGILPVIFILITTSISAYYKKLALSIILTIGFLYFILYGLGDRGHLGGIYNSGSIFGGQASLLTLISLLLFFNNKSPIYLIISLSFLTLLILSNHRTGIIALFVCGLYLILITRGHFTRKLVFGVFFILLTLYALPYLSSILFFDGVASIETINTSGRFAVWPTLLDEWVFGWRSFLLGSGAGFSQHILITQFDGINAGIVLPHNEFIRMCVDYGLIGALLCFGLIVRLINKYAEHSFIVCLHFFIECMLSNVLFWQITYLLPLFIFLRRKGSR